ncbi:MAG: dockerin type I repeat-containing protein [Bacteroidota bacterium]
MKQSFFLAALLLGLPLVAQLPSIQLPALATEALLIEDNLAGATRFAAAQQLPSNLLEQGSWTSLGQSPATVPQGQWEIKLEVSQSPGLGLFLDQVYLSPGASLEWRSKTAPARRWQQADVNEQGQLFLGFVKAESGRLIYRGPYFETDNPPFHLWRLDQIFRPDLFANGEIAARDFGESNECEIDANCPTGDGWDQEKSNNARIIVVVEEGTGYCSGNLMNNTAENGRPLLLSGFHCFDGFTPLYNLWRFDFEFRYANCGSTNPFQPDFISYTGATYLAGRRENDFLLLQITDASFDDRFHYFAGWDRSDGDVSGDLIVFHHPMGDVQALAAGNGMTIFPNTISWDNGVITPPSHHFRFDLAEGTSEVGSSGSAVFDDQRRVRGHINGGQVNCPGSSFLWIGRLQQAWTGGGAPSTRLSDWLDPLQLDTLQWDGNMLAGNTNGRILRGNCLNGEVPVENIAIYCNWSTGEMDTVYTDERGFYTLPRPATASSVVISGAYPEGGVIDGVDVLDAVAMRRHVLGQDTLSPLALLAADCNNSGSLTINDNLRLTQAILGLNEWVERPSWMVVPNLIPLEPGPVNPWQPVSINISNPNAVIAELDFYVIKNGDPNFSSAE